MATPASGSTRLLRAAVLGGSALALGAGAHVVGGGSLPAPGTLVLLALPLGLLTTWLTARRVKTPHLVGLLGVSQVALHHALGALEPAACAVAPAAASAHAGHGAVDLTGTCGPAAMHMAALPSGPMLLAHVLATALTALLLLRGEALLWRAVEALAPRVPGRPADLRGRVATPTVPIPAVLRPQRVPGRHRSRAPPAYA